MSTPDERPVFPFVSCRLEKAAEVTGISVSTIQKAIADGDLIANYVGRSPRILADELYAWVASLPTAPHRRTA